MKTRTIEIMDTTLRDGEQTSGVSFSASEKLTLAKLLLEELKVDRIEVASARVSEGELQAVKNITEWALSGKHHVNITRSPKQANCSLTNSTAPGTNLEMQSIW